MGRLERVWGNIGTSSMTSKMADTVGAEVVAHDGRVGGGGGAGVPLPGWAISLDERFAKPLRNGSPAILPRVSDGRCLIDLRCVPESDDAVILERLKELMNGDGA